MLKRIFCNGRYCVAHLIQDNAVCVLQGANLDMYSQPCGKQYLY